MDQKVVLQYITVKVCDAVSIQRELLQIDAIIQPFYFSEIIVAKSGPSQIL